MTRRTVGIETLAEFDDLAAAQVAAGTDSMRGWFVQSVDLTGRADTLARLDPGGAVFLGCLLDTATEDRLRAGGALLFPRLADVPFDPYRGALYSAEELYGGLEHGYATTYDATVYAWAKQRQHPADPGTTLAAALHDHAITDALDEVQGALPTAVGVMGGHGVARDEQQFRDTAWLARELTRRGRTVLTGGGPGAMEAANLGAYLAPFDDSALDEAATLLAATPSFTPRVDEWATAAFSVRERWPATTAGVSIGIPTWFYGHEPPNVFATHVAKYFSNALREDGLLHRCRAGVVYLPGAAGTVQEIFQAATEDYYAASAAGVVPLVLVGREHWTATIPAWPALEALARGRTMARAVHVVDSVAEALDLVA